MDKSMEIDYVIVNGREECHPLHNILILENIFKFLRLKDLKVARSVCTQWNDIATPYVQEKGVVRLDGNVHFESRTPQQFLQQFEEVAPEDIFFRNYQLNSWFIHGRCQQGIKFWEKFGVTMRSVELCSSRFLGIDILRNVLFYWTPRLCRLYLRDCSFYDVTDEEKSGYHVLKKATETKVDIPVNRNMISLGFFGGEPHVQPPLTWEEIFIGFPLLKQLQLYNLTASETTEVLEAITKRIQSVPGSLEIEKLNIFNGDFALQTISSENLELLTKLDIPLKNLHMDIGVFLNHGQFAKCLRVFAKNLKKLKMYRGPLSVPMDIFPFKISFPNLTVLKITDTVSDNLSFLEFMPNLRELGVLYMVNNDFPLIYTDIVRNTSVQMTGPFNKLETFSMDYSLCREEIDRLFALFPNVKKLRMNLDDKSFRRVCNHWTKLMDLEVLGCKVTDDGILGEICQITEESGQVINYRLHNHLLDLTELKRFKMNNSGSTTLITDAAILQGFMNLKNLVHFELCSEHVKDGWATLFGNPRITTLIPTDGTWSNIHVEPFTRQI